MKKKLLLFTISAGLISLSISSYKAGPASNGYDCTGAETGGTNAHGCSSGSTCHATVATPTVVVALELDSNGTTPVKHYIPGMTYTVKLTGTNNSTYTLPKFGFQVSAIKGTTPSAAPVNAGSFDSTTLPTNVRYEGGWATLLAANIVEHRNSLPATSGTGGAGTTYSVSFKWTAPAAGTGVVTLWSSLNAVDGTDGTADTSDRWNTAIDTLNEWTHLGVNNVTNELSMVAYPNPVVNNLNIMINNANIADYTVMVYDLNGKMVVNEHFSPSNTNIYSVSTANWMSGLYFVKVTGGGIQKTSTIIKQ